MKDFLIAAIDDQPAGLIGLEQYGDVGLLRSLVVDATARQRGVGRQLVAALEDLAYTRGVTELWLLTTERRGLFQIARVRRGAAGVTRQRSFSARPNFQNSAPPMRS